MHIVSCSLKLHIHTHNFHSFSNIYTHSFFSLPFPICSSSHATHSGSCIRNGCRCTHTSFLARGYLVPPGRFSPCDKHSAGVFLADACMCVNITYMYVSMNVCGYVQGNKARVINTFVGQPLSFISINHDLQFSVFYNSVGI